ncbi:MAG: hypothetical protein AB1544_02290 [Pseudomonadota bacterium]|jgi:hypothetical protein
MRIVARHQVEHGHAVAREAAGDLAPLRQRRRVEVIDDARPGVEGRVVGVRTSVGFGESGQRGDVGLARAAVLERGEDGEIAFGCCVGSLDDACFERRRGACQWYGCRRAGADFRECVDQRGREIAVERIDTGEAVPVVMRRVRARPAQRELDGEAQPLSLAR